MLYLDQLQVSTHRKEKSFLEQLKNRTYYG